MFQTFDATDICATRLSGDLEINCAITITVYQEDYGAVDSTGRLSFSFPFKFFCPRSLIRLITVCFLIFILFFAF